MIRSAEIGVDNLVDEKGYSHKYLLRILKLTKDVWNKREFRIQNKYERQFVSAIKILRKLFDDGFSHQTKQVYEDLLRGYNSEYKWAFNRKRILSSTIIKKFNTNIGAEVVAIFLYLLQPRTSKNLKISEKIVQKYGFAIKSADNLNSLYDDIFEGFITIPKEDIHEVSGLVIKNNKLIDIDKKGLKISKRYILKSTKEVERTYQKANRLLDKNRQKLGLTKTQTNLFKKWADTWLEDARVEI